MSAGIEDSLELARRATAGDAAAFRSLLERYRERVLERVRLLMGPRARKAAESGDFLQGALVEALEGFERGNRLRDEKSVLRWLTVIARNNIHDAVRRERERAFESLSASWFEGPGEVQERSPASQAELDESTHVLIEALEQLDADHRRVIELRALEGLRFKEVARSLGRSEDAARMLYRRSLTRLGERLGELDG